MPHGTKMLDQPRSLVDSFFFWVGAFCTLVVLCVVCSCCVLAPISRRWRERRADKDSRAGGPGAGQRKGDAAQLEHRDRHKVIQQTAAQPRTRAARRNDPPSRVPVLW